MLSDRDRGDQIEMVHVSAAKKCFPKFFVKKIIIIIGLSQYLFITIHFYRYYYKTSAFCLSVGLSEVSCHNSCENSTAVTAACGRDAELIIRVCRCTSFGFHSN